MFEKSLFGFIPKILLVLILSALFLISYSENAFSQKRQIPNGKQTVTLKKDNNNFSQTPNYNLSQEELEIMNKMNQLKLENNSVNGEKILELQKKLESINGSTITKQETNPIGALISSSRYNPSETDNLTTSSVLNYVSNYVAGISAQVEQRGTTAGKIWLAIGLANGDTGALARPDTIGIYYSNNNGTTYNLYAKIAFSNHNRIEFDNIDMEIIENTSGTKYLYIVFGYTTNGGYGQRLIGYTIVSAPTLGYFGSTLSFPGSSPSNSYRTARITSDNTRYPNNPFVTIAVTEDSVSGANYFVMSKICRVLSPYALNPALTYLSKSIYSPVAGFNYNVITDVANYHNGFDSLIFVLSNYPGFNNSIYLYKAFSNATIYPSYAGTITPTGDDLEFARVAANGGTDQLKIMITYSDNYLNAGDFDQWILTTQDASNWSASTLDYTNYNSSRYGDVIGRRGADGSFAVSFKNIFGNMENVSAYTFTDFSISNSIHSLNTDYANSLASPKPLFRYLNGDSCLNIWSYYYTVSSTGGCSASNLYVTIGLEGFYDEGTGYHSLYAPVYILLAEPDPPYNIVDTGLAVLDYTSLSNVFAFPKALTGDFSLIIKHFNCIETWSAAPVHLDPVTPGFYDFTSSDAQAYGNNMVLRGTRWCIYSGDVNQDGIIDLTDLQIIDNDVYNFVTGMAYASDLNGDYFVDIADYTIADNNAYNFVSKVIP